MISGEKILISGVTGMVAEPLARFLAKDNEVWGIARFQDCEVRESLEEEGITTRIIDMGAGDFSSLPTDFTYVLHLAWMRADLSQLQEAIRTNVEGPGLMLQHCRKAKAALVMSGMGIYSPNPDPWHAYHEEDPIGRGATAYAATSPACKLGVESVARFCARAFNLPVVIPRLCTFMGSVHSYPAHVIRAVIADQPVSVPYAPNPHSPIHLEDIKLQLEAMLEAASTRGTISNWCGDEIVSVQEWGRMAAELSGKTARFKVAEVHGAPRGTVADPARRRAIAGPCQTVFKDEFCELYKRIVGEN